MKITVDKDYTMGVQMNQVKTDIAEFKANYTEEDVLNAFRSQMDFWKAYGTENLIIKTTCKAFPGGTYYQNKTHFAFIMVLDAYDTMYKLSFYMDSELNLPNPSTCSIRKYSLEV